MIWILVACLSPLALALMVLATEDPLQPAFKVHPKDGAWAVFREDANGLQTLRAEGLSHLQATVLAYALEAQHHERRTQTHAH